MRDQDINRHQWNRRTDAHYRHPDYRVAEFLEGQSTLHDLELREVGEVKGKSLLHLQCHFGLDTLSWARLGARVTGIDLSDRSIEMAEQLRLKSGLAGCFLRTDLYDLPEHLDELFDIVFASYGVLWWMSDIVRWGRVAARYVKPGGFLYLAEIHPALHMLDADKKVIEPYFHQGAERYFNEHDYCDADLIIEEEVGWRWTLGDVVNALIKAGLTIEFLHEHPFCVDRRWPNFVRNADGWYYYPDLKKDVPMAFSVKAFKK